VGLSQRMLDAARRHYVRLPHQSGNALHLHCLNGAAMLASDRMACSGAAPLLPLPLPLPLAPTLTLTLTPTLPLTLPPTLSRCGAASRARAIARHLSCRGDRAGGSAGPAATVSRDARWRRAKG
jgi:hypothetical protein